MGNIRTRLKDQKTINYGKHPHLLRRETKESSLGGAVLDDAKLRINSPMH